MAWMDGLASHDASDLREVTPTMLLVHFDTYTGPPVTCEKIMEDVNLVTHIAQHLGADNDEESRLRLKHIFPIFRSR
ncbi:hypothetical protein E4U50_007344 [Claviceps purpurea]|nr:hypothetical protein E4U27_000512 [Claviceps purpurea]KAG6215521.1 hypothetical protein E4U50_007344 [Claviceps purpurea]